VTFDIESPVEVEQIGAATQEDVLTVVDKISVVVRQGGVQPGGSLKMIHRLIGRRSHRSGRIVRCMAVSLRDRIRSGAPSQEWSAFQDCDLKTFFS
jgi:hypothetical protein